MVGDMDFKSAPFKKYDMTKLPLKSSSTIGRMVGIKKGEDNYGYQVYAVEPSEKFGLWVRFGDALYAAVYAAMSGEDYLTIMEGEKQSGSDVHELVNDGYTALMQLKHGQLCLYQARNKSTPMAEADAPVDHHAAAVESMEQAHRHIIKSENFEHNGSFRDEDVRHWEAKHTQLAQTYMFQAVAEMLMAISKKLG